MKLLFFHQPKCAPCKIAKPIVEEVRAETGVEVEYKDVTTMSGAMLASQHRIVMTPTVVLVDGEGNRKFGLVGKLINKNSLIRLIGNFSG